MVKQLTNCLVQKNIIEVVTQDNQKFSYPNTFENTILLSKHFQHPNLDKVIKSHYEDDYFYAFEKERPAPSWMYEDYEKKPYEHQQTTLNIMEHYLLKYNQGIGLFIEQRGGKTFSIAWHLEKFKERLKSVLFTCEGGNRQDIISQVKTAAPSFKIFTLFKINTKNKSVNLSPKERSQVYEEFAQYEGYKILISTTQTLALDYDNDLNKKSGKKLWALASFDTIVIDEGNFLRNRSKQTKVLEVLRKRCGPAYVLTGTPAVNAPTEFINIANFLKPKNQEINKRAFLEYFCNKQFNPFAYSKEEYTNIKPEKEKEFANWLKTFSVIFKTKDVLHWVKEPNKQDVLLDMVPKQKEVYERMLETMKREVINDSGETTIERESNVATQFLRLRQLAIDPRMLKVDIVGAKTLHILNWIKNNPDEPVIIFSFFTSYLYILKQDILDNLGLEAVLVTGRQKPEEKHNAMMDFQKGKTNIILCNLEAGSKGFTFDRSKTMMFIDRSYRPDLNSQAEARFVDIEDRGYHKDSMIYDLLSNDTIEKKVRDSINDKLSKTKIINNFKEWLTK